MPSKRYTGLIDKYRDYLPVHDDTRLISLGEGQTPLIRLNNIPGIIGKDVDIYVKYEGLNPTGSFKDRGMTMAVTKAVEEGMQAVLDTVAPGVSCGAVHAAWQKVLDRYGLVKESRIGYGIGVGYSPDWGEHTISLRPREATLLETGHSLHIILGMWMEGWGMELSETVLVTANGCRCLTDFARGVHVVD